MDNSGVSDSKWLMIQSTVASFTSNVEDNEISETSGLSPLTSTLDQSLNLQDDGLFNSDIRMGIENTWSEMSHVSSDCPIPLPPITRSDDFSNNDSNNDPIGESSLGIEHGPFLPPNTPTLNNLFTESVDNQDDTAVEVTTPTGVCGLHNLGNTCFMAAGLQCLTATPPVLQHFLELPCDEKLLPTESLMARFSSLLSKMWSGRYSVVKPTEFKQTLGAYHTQFKDYRQHDCQEFLALLLDSLHEQMNVARASKSSHVPASTTTANMINSHQNGAKISEKEKFIIDMYDNPPSSLSPNSPRLFIGGSPRSNYGDLDSTANSLQGSPLNDDEEDEETLDSDEIIGAKSSFSNKQENGATDSLRLDKLLELSKTNSECEFYDKDGKENSGRDCDAVYSRSPLDNDPESVNDNHNFDNKSTNTKRLKEAKNAKNNCGVDCMSSGSDAECDGTLDKCSVKRMRLDSHEKNFRRDNQTESQCLRLSTPLENGALASHEETEADKHWVKHLRSNRSVIVDTFQGQFKSTVVCEVCKHVSVTYEPFMYLSVPLPHAMERQLTVTYIPANDDPPIRCVVSLNKQSKVDKLKEELLKIIGKEHLSVSNIAMAEVLENHISKILDNSTLLRQIDVSNRLIYAFELLDHPDPNIIANELNDNAERLPAADNSQVVSSTTDENHLCMICYEEIDANIDDANKNKGRVRYLKKHSENNCNLRMCNTCIEKYFKKPQTERPCPMCNSVVTESSFTDIDQTGRPRPAVRILSIPVVLRYDDTDSETSQHVGSKLFGHPHLVKLPSQISAKSLCEVLNRFVPQESKYTVRLVDGQGQRCSRCIYTQHCTGCPIPESGTVVLQNNDTLAVVYSDYIPEVAEPIDHISVSKQRSQHPLSLYDCLQAFSQSETLDEHNPWFCPKCKKNQCATKTLTVHRYPKFLIVYLKRFVFYECVSMKLDDRVTFPLVDLNVGRHLYDLYACVCHFGGVSAGHYTAYTRNPQTSVWHYYNDEATSKQKPQEEDFSHAYILFYTRQENNLKSCNI